MRLKKGDRVEVMKNIEAPVSCRVAEMLSGNDRTYRVAYDSYPAIASQKKVDTVSRKFVRQCQPLVQGADNYISGDKRILLGKSSGGGEYVASNKPSTSICYQQTKFQIPQYARVKKQHQKESMNILDGSPLQESYNHSRSLKRKSTYDSSINEACHGHTQKFRGIKDHKNQRRVAAPVLEKKPYRTMTCSSRHLNLGLHVWYILRTRSSTSLLFTEAHLEARFICFQGLKLTPGFAAFVLA